MARLTDHPGNSSEVGVGIRSIGEVERQRRVRITRVEVVQHVERLGLELHRDFTFLRQPDVLQQTEVEVLETRSEEQSRRCVADAQSINAGQLEVGSAKRIIQPRLHVRRDKWRGSRVNAQALRGCSMNIPLRSLAC